jgi:endonuclease YncB( thermonuclease family)
MVATARTFQLWVYIVRWIDGDTFKGVIDQGFHHYLGSIESPVSVRCARINAPELKTGQPGAQAHIYAESLAPINCWYPAVSFKPDEYGRPLMDLLLVSRDGQAFSSVMLAAGQAVRYD